MNAPARSAETEDLLWAVETLGSMNPASLSGEVHAEVLRRFELIAGGEVPAHVQNAARLATTRYRNQMPD